MRNALSLLVFCAWVTCSVAAEPSAASNVPAHDPSTIIQDGQEYWFFSTGRGILSRHSKDLVHWEIGPSVFSNSPSWTTNAVPGFHGHFWAPDIIRVQGRLLLYYAVSTWGSRTSAIGLATNLTLDPASPNYHWSDCGPVVQTSPQVEYNAIDPSVFLDNAGRLWLAFGSYWSGIKLIQLDPKTGLRADTNSHPVGLAWKNAIEASCLVQHDNYYYLFVNWGQCCKGTNSTYNIRVGRSLEPTGPYLDRDGVNMVEGGGSLFVGSEGRFIGPGHAGLVKKDGATWCSYHFYDGDRHGMPSLGIRRLEWETNGWPALRESLPVSLK